VYRVAPEMVRPLYGIEGDRIGGADAAVAAKP
jgi:hypothetical protein